MAEEGKRLHLETPEGWAIQPINDTHTAVIFRMKDGATIGVALGKKALSLFTGRLLSEAGKLAAKKTPEFPPERLLADPVPVTSIGYAPNPQDESSALLTLQTGNLLLTYDVDMTSLRELCAKLVSDTEISGDRTSH